MGDGAKRVLAANVGRFRPEDCLLLAVFERVDDENVLWQVLQIHCTFAFARVPSENKDMPLIILKGARTASNHLQLHHM